MFFERNRNTRPHNWLIHHYCVRSVKMHAPRLSGRVLDIGCGIEPYREIVEKHCTEYVGLDRPTTPHGLKDVEVVGDALSLPFDDESFDSVVSFQVMEHVAEPRLFLSEAFRVMKPGGTALLMTPFMWGEHEQPRDYYRYTRYGLRYLAAQAGFEVDLHRARHGLLVDGDPAVQLLAQSFRQGAAALSADAGLAESVPRALARSRRPLLHRRHGDLHLPSPEARLLKKGLRSLGSGALFIYRLSNPAIRSGPVRRRRHAVRRRRRRNRRRRRIRRRRPWACPRAAGLR